ncbi:MAG TPA: cytochrome P450 [Ornithinimicrobium sp.]|uniref:bifunctional cytochrome P450/NADPH--P450 reductase n=1 Tax=Ornithinimicrobium sp. TaxID=1977084 RepID=UPI002B464719|nr:cytochrome P450 [Ornithinimicrobium sp.]HKJ10954.1 cytochrome P450 [Ornithinimicrobium sp.]
MSDRVPFDEIPGPKGKPFIGNLLDLDMDSPIESLMGMAEEHGSIFKISVAGQTRVFVSDPGMVDQICDDSTFHKKLAAGIKQASESAFGSGLFTTANDDPIWQKAHNILMAPFSQASMRTYVPAMVDIADQLMTRYSRLNDDDNVVHVTDDMTSVTLDTIALCGFGYRFNSLHRETPHPFVGAMVRGLSTAQDRTKRLPAANRVRIREQRRIADDQEYMTTLVQGLIDRRRAEGEDADNADLLGIMLTGVDPRSGEGLPDYNIVAQCITFLIAGHETTSGLLSFALYFLMNNPEYFERARAEVDEVLGTTASPTYEQVHSLTYITQVLEEALRLWPTAPVLNRAPNEDTLLGGRYEIPAEALVTTLIPMLHRSTETFGENAAEFDPDHMSPENKAELPPHAYKPFGTGMRACIGRQFALQEAALILGMFVQRFDIEDALGYELKLKTALTIKPDGFYARIVPREGFELDRTGPSSAAQGSEDTEATAVSTLPGVEQHDTPLRVLFGSNLGTAEGIATKLAAEGTERGYDVTLASLDEHARQLDSDGATLVVSSSYNGLPPENARGFTEWLQEAGTPDDAFAGGSFAVFGCGDRDWAATYQKVPTLLDAELEAHGGTRVHPRGEGNVGGDFDGEYRAWHKGLWEDLAEALELPQSAATVSDSGPRLTVTAVNPQASNPVIVSYEAAAAVVRVNRELERGHNGHPLDRSVRHLEVALPAGMTYSTGDHLGIVPRNDLGLIRRVMARFTLDAGMYLTIVEKEGTQTHLPTDEPVPLLSILGTSVELQDLASRESIEKLTAYTKDPQERAALESLVGDDEESSKRYREQIVKPYRSVLDLLEEHPSCALPFEEYLDMLPPIRPRYYSISSSPKVDAEAPAVTAAVVRAPNRGRDGVFAGVASNYLAAVAPGNSVFAFTRTPTIAFHPPADPTVPMMVVGAGTGLAPFRGFLQERAALKAEGAETGPSLVFFGCREPNDDIYADELEQFEQDGVATVHTVYSSQPIEDRRYVQHEITRRADEVWDLVEQGGYIYVCGNANTMAPGVRAALMDIHRERTGGTGQDAESWLSDLREQDRFVEDIWGGSG